jgi:hypothetical protein
MLMRLKSNTSVHSAATASRIRTRQSAIKTPFMCAAIRGHAQLSPDTIGLSTILLTDLAKLIPAAIAAMNFYALVTALVRVP